MPRKRSWHSPARTDKIDAGFSILELTVVVVVLGILSSIALPRIGNALAAAEIDAAKALLNSAAADCLQNSRLNAQDRDLIDETIVSDKQLNTLGFQIDTANDANRCSYFQITPTNDNDNIRYPFGFSVSDGSLSKFANPTSTDKGSIRSCERWAGVNCKQDQSLKTLIDWKNNIAAAKQTCENNYTTWLTEKNTQPREYKRWNPNASAGCPAKPPKDGSTSYKTSPSCTTDGCNLTVYGLDGEFVGFTESDYDRALEAKYGKACTEWVERNKQANYTNDPQNQPAKLKECGSQEFWFYRGVDVGSRDEFNKRICSDNLEIEKMTAGQRTVQGCGSQTYYFCDNKIKESEKDYKECSCEVDKYNRAQAGNNGKFSTTEQGANGCGDFWICNQEILNDEASFNNKCGVQTDDSGSSGSNSPSTSSCRRPRPQCDQTRYYRHRKCIEYSKCMGRI